MEYLIKKSSMPQKSTQSFKPEKKKVQDWVRRQFSRKMSEDSTFIKEIEQVAAVAAAAYAINAIQESMMPEPGSKVPVIAATEEKEPEKTVRPRSIRKTPTFADTKPESDPGTSVKKDPSFADKNLNSTNGKKSDTPTIKPRTPVPKPEQPTVLKPRTPSIQTRRQSSARAETGETKADAWERKEIGKINKRYDKLKDEILSWESKKKTKAKRLLNKNEQELEQRRLKAQHNFQSKIEYIEQIAGGARAQAEEKRRNEEFKVKHKADKIRTTGKTPATGFCC